MEFRVKTDDVKKRYREYEIAGDISVQNIEQLVDGMRGCVQDCDELHVDLRQITGFDAAAFQFFISLKNSFVRDRKKLRVSCKLDPAVAQLLANCGIPDLAATLSIGDD